MLHMLRALLSGLAMAVAMQTTFANFAWTATTDQRGDSFKTCPDLRQNATGSARRLRPDTHLSGP